MSSAEWTHAFWVAYFALLFVFSFGVGYLAGKS